MTVMKFMFLVLLVAFVVCDIDHQHLHPSDGAEHEPAKNREHHAGERNESESKVFFLSR